MSETKNPDYAKGKIVVGSMGWSSYSVVDPSLTQVCRKGTMIMMIMNMLMMGWCSFVIVDPSSTQYEDDNGDAFFDKILVGTVPSSEPKLSIWTAKIILCRNLGEQQCIWWNPYRGR